MIKLFLSLLVFLSVGESAKLGEQCHRNSECKVPLSECSEELSVCICKPYSIQTNSTTCLPGSLLGFECEIDQQCSIKVPTSSCVYGKCECGRGYIPYRRHTCLSPSKLGDVCFDNDQCQLADRGSYCKFVVPKVFGRCQCQSGRELGPKNKCSAANTKIGHGCDEDADCPIKNAFCQTKLDGLSICTCDTAFTPSSDRTRCMPTYRGLLSATSLGYPCYAHLQCQLSDPNSICNEGVCDCIPQSRNLNLRSGSTCSAKNTGCHKDTFQCQADGKCISWYFVLDGKWDCEDGSDEIVDGECPEQAFYCGDSFKSNKTLNSLDKFREREPRSPACISRSKICDGRIDCPDGRDEVDCKAGKDGICPPGTFQCSNSKECLPQQHFCNAIGDCKDLSDENEQKCRIEFQPAEFCPFRCDNGLCRSSAIVCSGVDGCGDNSDEDPKRCQVCRCPRLVPPS